VGDLPHSNTELKKTSIVLLIFLTIITFGIYYPVWFLRRRNAINNLQSKEQLGVGVFVFAIVVLSISLFVYLLSGSMEGIADGLGEKSLIPISTGLDLFSMTLYLVAGIAIFFQCFKVRRIFNEHFNTHLEKGISFSVAATFLFQILPSIQDE
jgi:hypothetical protein